MLDNLISSEEFDASIKNNADLRPTTKLSAKHADAKKTNTEKKQSSKTSHHEKSLSPVK